MNKYLKPASERTAPIVVRCLTCHLGFTSWYSAKKHAQNVDCKERKAAHG
jgi:hypothetical protein